MVNRKLKMITFFLYLLVFTFILTLANSTPIETYISSLKQESIQVSSEKDPIEQEIKDLAKQIDHEPINARIDRVWKAIPGYNGLQVDQEKSYQLSKQLGHVSLKSLSIQEIEPEIQLEDLPPSPIYRGNSNKAMISLMVNVAWGTEHVEQMLTIFEQYGISVTFFLDGKWLKENKVIAQKMISEGHEIGNHAYSHPDLRKMSVDQISDEILKTNKLIEELGVQSHLFAPPSGAFDQRVVQIAHQYKMKTILWTLDTVDWKRPPSSVIVDKIVPHLENGALILMHPTAPTVEALPQMIEGALERELLPGTVSQLISPARSISVVRLD
jgi:probable sporulation protein (polysaccharide deacetylase family)